MQPAASTSRRASRAAVLACAIAPILTPFVLAQQTGPATQSAASTTLERIRQTGRVKIGYRTDARPFSFNDGSGAPSGYSVALCRLIADALKAEPGLASVQIDWAPVTAGDRFRAVQNGQIDLLCSADTVTVSRRNEVSFSIPIFPGGLGAVIRSDTSARLREVLSGRGQPYRPVWRAAATRVLQAKAFSAVSGTTTEKWLTARMRELEVIAEVSLVNSYDDGLRALLDRRLDVFFGERAVLLDAARRHASARDLVVVDRLFTYEPLAVAFARGDEQLRLIVDQTLSRFYGSGKLGELYTQWFGEPDATTLTFFRWNTLPE